MRVEISITTPEADSYGRTDHCTKNNPCIESSEVLDYIDEALRGFKHFKPGMEIEILIKEDWTYES